MKINAGREPPEEIPLPEIVLGVQEPGADGLRLTDLTGMLKSELAALDGVDVVNAAGPGAPDGARAFDSATIGTLVASVPNLAVYIESLVGLVRAWIKRSGSMPRSVRVQIGDDVLELQNPSQENQDELVALFVGRHAGKKR